MDLSCHMSTHLQIHCMDHRASLSHRRVMWWWQTQETTALSSINICSDNHPCDLTPTSHETIADFICKYWTRSPYLMTEWLLERKCKMWCDSNCHLLTLLAHFSTDTRYHICKRDDFFLSNYKHKMPLYVGRSVCSGLKIHVCPLLWSFDSWAYWCAASCSCLLYPDLPLDHSMMQGVLLMCLSLSLWPFATVLTCSILIVPLEIPICGDVYHLCRAVYTPASFKDGHMTVWLLILT